MNLHALQIMRKVEYCALCSGVFLILDYEKSGVLCRGVFLILDYEESGVLCRGGVPNT